MTETAAIFDLDRTLLAGASGPVFSEAMRDAGVLPGRSNPLEPLLFRIFEAVGENSPTMWFTRQAVRVTRGWSRDDVRAAARRATPALEAKVLPYARQLLEEHRREGRLLVLATTTPDDLARPLAEALGFDHVIANRYGTAPDGTYDGTVEGEYVWGKGKARAVRAWADENGVDLSESYAYSDSYYDVPLLSLVGHPSATNPDPRLRAIAALRRWPARWFDVPATVPKFAGLEPQRAVMTFARAELFPWVRFRIYGAQHIPKEGAAILIANHRSYFDPLAIGFALAKRGRTVRFLGKKEVFDVPVVGDLTRAMGGIRVDRATGSDQPLVEAEEALAAGDLVAVMPQGTIPRGREFFNPELKGRWGAARLAHASKVPVIPIGLWGTERVWPRSSKVPNLTNLVHPPTVTIRVGKPVALEYDDLDADTVRMMSAITSLLPPEAQRTHEPTPEELARTMPSGRADDADDDREASRRPGTD
ncbi:MAG TPA: HAD-IB family hydrolase [Microthrixaceae bacterium]|nr:HAD-IB family hydrolase [Microthrixaceae bacterium]